MEVCMGGIPTILTPSLALRPFTEADAKPLHRVMGVPGVMDYFPRQDAPSLDRVQKLVSGQLKHWDEHGYGWWAVALRTSSELIGWAGLQFLPETNETEVAYLLGKDYWGQGLATEAARASVCFGFEGWDLPFIVGIVHPENVGSQRVLEKAGMTFVERSVYFGMDCLRYVLQRGSWHDVRPDWGSAGHPVCGPLTGGIA